MTNRIKGEHPREKFSAFVDGMCGLEANAIKRRERNDDPQCVARDQITPMDRNKFKPRRGMSPGMRGFMVALAREIYR